MLHSVLFQLASKIDISKKNISHDLQISFDKGDDKGSQKAGNVNSIYILILKQSITRNFGFIDFAPVTLMTKMITY